MAAVWIDLPDPSADELRAKAPRELEENALELLLRRPRHLNEPRATMQSHGDYVFGIFLAAEFVEARREITHEAILTVRDARALPRVRHRAGQADGETERPARDDRLTDRRPVPRPDRPARRADRPARRPRHGRPSRRARASPSSATGCSASAARSRRCATRFGAWSTTSSCRGGEEVFPNEVEIAFKGAYDKLLRCVDGLELSRDLLASVRDYSQAKIANGSVGSSVASSLGAGTIGAVPFYICPNCKDRSIDIDGFEGMSTDAVACHRCGFGFLFELMDDYYPGPNTGLVVCDQEGRILASGRGVFELTGWGENDLMGHDVVQGLGLTGFEDGKNPVALALEWGVRRLGEQLQLRTKAGVVKPVIADLFPAYDDDGGLLVALSPRAG